MSSYKYLHIMEYLPVRFSATAQQKMDRQTIYNFKDGYCSSTLKQQIADGIKQIKEAFPYQSWRVCFIPASTRAKTSTRYAALASYIRSATGIPCDITTISPIHDEMSGHLGGKKANPAENFQIESNCVNGQNIILIDDVITRGNTFVSTAEKLVENGARDVVGLFLAKTVHPNVCCA